jgi:U3 small nucleolar RNA-associated protein 10
LGSYVALAALSQKCKLAPPAIDVILRAVIYVQDGVTIDHALPVFVSVCGSQEEIKEIPQSAILELGKVP